MPNADALAFVESTIRRSTGSGFVLRTHTALSGGCSHDSFCVEDGSTRYFVKLGSAEAGDLFAAEADGLEALAAHSPMRTPSVIARDADERHACLVLEWLDLRRLETGDDGERFAEALAAQHRNTGDQFGWHRDNFIGPTPQINTPGSNWARFFARHRLAPQLARARQNGYTGDLQRHGERLLDRLSALFLDYRPQASLLHGDLWHGNAAMTTTGEPAIFDPAVCRGDRESDLAMCELFGGFPPSFYAAYRRVWPLNDGFETRKPLYALYHVLNHLNLFGRGYLGEAVRLAKRIDAELGPRGE